MSWVEELFTAENMTAAKAVLASAGAGLLVFLGRASKTKMAMRKDGAEGDLYAQLSGALNVSETRRKEESEAFLEREREHERRHEGNVNRMMELTQQVGELRGTVQGLQDQLTRAIHEIREARQDNLKLVAENTTLLGQVRDLLVRQAIPNVTIPATL